MSRRAIVLLVVILLAGTVLAPVSSAQEEVTVPLLPYGATHYVDEGDSIVLTWGWAATTRGLVQSFLTANNASYALSNGWTLSAEDSAEYFSAPYSVPAEDHCPMKEVWRSRWSYPLGTLAAGTYTLTTTWAVTHPVTDGYHVCTDPGEPKVGGAPPLWRPDGPGAAGGGGIVGSWTSTVTIIVESDG